MKPSNCPNNRDHLNRPTATGRFDEGMANLAAALPAPADGVEEPEIRNG